MNLLKRIRYPEIQLFDLKEDPWELNDIAQRPKHQSKINELKTAINWMKQQGDDGHLQGKGIMRTCPLRKIPLVDRYFPLSTSSDSLQIIYG